MRKPSFDTVPSPYLITTDSSRMSLIGNYQRGYVLANSEASGVKYAVIYYKKEPVLDLLVELNAESADILRVGSLPLFLLNLSTLF